MLDFKELPKDGILFEQLIRELLVLDGYETHWTGVGQDGGRDLVIIEKLTGELSTYERKWLVSCKHSAHSGKSIGKDDIGNISEDCKAIGAEGYILACTTQPTANLITRLNEIKTNQKIITKFWDSIELEKRLTKPNTFGLIHTFFPKSSECYKWKIFNTNSPSFWAANYKDYFFYMSSRLSNNYPPLKCTEAIIKLFEQVPIYKGHKNGYDSHFLRLRGVFYDDKYSQHIAYVDYICPNKCDEKLIMDRTNLYYKLNAGFTDKEHEIMNEPLWDVIYYSENIAGDGFDLNHKSYYEQYMKCFEYGSARTEFLNSPLPDIF